MGKILGISLLSASFFYLYNKIRMILKLKKREALLKQAQLKKQKDYLNKLKSYNAINNYTICLSLDYKVKRTFSVENKIIINKIIFAQIRNSLLKLGLKAGIKNLEDVLVIASDDFDVYDNLYSALLRILSKIKPEIDDRYDVVMIPNITTDAYTIRPDIERIKECRKMLQDRTGLLSGFQGMVELILISKMSLQANPENYIDDVLAVYKQLRSNKLVE